MVCNLVNTGEQIRMIMNIEQIAAIQHPKNSCDKDFNRVQNSGLKVSSNDTQPTEVYSILAP